MQNSSSLIIGGTGSQSQYCMNILKGVYADIERVDIEKYPVLGDSNNDFIVAHGSIKLKEHIVSNLMGLHFTQAISPDLIHEEVDIREGCIINPGVILSNLVTIHRHSIIHSGVVIEHNVIVGEFASICAGVVIGGRVLIGKKVFIGLNATILPGVVLGAGCVVGAGAVVIKNVRPYTTVVGVPAKLLKVKPCLTKE